MRTVTAYLTGGPKDGTFVHLGCDLLGHPPLSVHFSDLKPPRLLAPDQPVPRHKTFSVFRYAPTGRVHVNGDLEYKCEMS